MARLEGKVALVTGAARGLGRAQCLRLAEAGAAVGATDILDEEGGQLVDEIRSNGGTAEYRHLDVSDEEQVRKVIGEIAEHFGGLNVLVNNAGISGTDAPTDELTEAQWDQVQAVNVKGVFFCVKHAVPHLRRAGGGSIINLSSIYGMIGAPDIPPYHASKGAVREMTKVDAMLYAGDSIRVNSVHPGFIETPLVRQLAEDKPEPAEEFLRKTAELHPLGRMGRPDDVAWGVVFLASDESSFMTGSELVIDGGYTAQ